MPFLLAGFTESQDSATLVNVAALADAHLTISGDDLRIPAVARFLVGAYALGPSVTRAQLLSPSLRRIVNPEIAPIDRNALPASPVPISMFITSPIELLEDESLNAQAAEDGAGATRATILVFLADGAISPVEGEIFTVRVTNATTLTANVWTNGALTFDQTLPPGEYAIVGAQFRSTDMQAFRFVGVGGGLRPGGIGSDAVADIVPPGQRKGGWGEWMRFRHTTPPTVEFLANAGNSSQTGEIDLIKVA